MDFVRDAFGHLKAIGCTPDAEPLLQKAGVARDEGVTGLDKKFVSAAAQALLRPRAEGADAGVTAVTGAHGNMCVP